MKGNVKMWKLGTSAYSHILHSKDQQIIILFFFPPEKKTPVLVSKIFTETWNIPNEARHCNAYNESLVYMGKR